MNSRITFRMQWKDDHVIELAVEVFDGRSNFSNDVYVTTDVVAEVIDDLMAFRDYIDDHSYTIRFGEFGPEYANGAFHAEMRFHVPGRLFIYTHQQSDFEVFAKSQVASEAKMHLSTEPILLDNFISELMALNSGLTNEATLVCA